MSFFLRRNIGDDATLARSAGNVLPRHGKAREKVFSSITLPNGKKLVRINRAALRRANEHLKKAS